MQFSLLIPIAIALFTFEIKSVIASPSINSISDNAVHGNLLTIVGSSFGEKNYSKPVWFDDGEGTIMGNNSFLTGESGDLNQVISSLSAGNVRYSEADPRTAGDPFNIAYRPANYRSMPAPHSHSSTFITGGHKLNYKVNITDLSATDHTGGGSCGSGICDASTYCVYSQTGGWDLTIDEDWIRIYATGNWDAAETTDTYAYHQVKKYISPNYVCLNEDPTNGNDATGGIADLGCESATHKSQTVEVTIPVPIDSETIYASWYERVDDQWPDNDLQKVGSVENDNYKYFAINSTLLYENHIYFNDNNNTTPQYKLGYEAGRDYPGQEEKCGWEEYPATQVGCTKYRHASVFGNWIKREFVYYKGKTASQGYYKVYANGKVIWEPLLSNTCNLTNTTCDWWTKIRGSENMQSVTVGGYWRDRICNKTLAGIAEGNNNAWRYFDDIYIDNTLQRIMFCDRQILTGDGTDICEMQIPIAWADNRITFKANLGKLPDFGTAYLFVFDSDNEKNSIGFPITLGGADTDAPLAPNGLVVQ